MKNTFFTLVVVLISLNLGLAQVGIGTTIPDESAELELQSTEKGFLPPRLTTAQRDDNIVNPAEGLTIYNTDQKCLNVYVGLGWRNLCAVVGANDVVNPQTGKIWMDRNLGATQVAIALDDADAYGDLYQWGRTADGHEKRNSPTYSAVLSTDGVSNFNNDPANAWDGEFILRDSGANNWVDPSVSGVDNLWQGVNSANNPCPTGYRVPSEAELNAERLSWSSNNAAGAYASPLKLPVAGSRRRLNGGFFYVGFFGRYWCSTVSGADARRLGFKGSGGSMGSRNRANGLSVRCLKD
ncbi:hypothetical protein GCM10010832_04200 [Psychroflexus planctonicus]|uniref:Fibrobacter succinogenes major paralogous domain-containing protein n=2 Tax=Psychroflexus planctonicus TaxID=1526575 RepID=A0ABQ1SCA7_9FLAO|nr:hypothetical protein GCM10010832_04200 [Psychroflexus planctonicus]